MKKYLLPNSGNFYKANLHVHSNVSDGKLTPEQLKEGYKSKGYSVLAYTDHEVFVPQNHLTDNEFLALNAVEISINDDWPGDFINKKTYHLNLYAKSDKQKDCFACTEDAIWLEQSKPYVSEFTKNNTYKKCYNQKSINDLIARANEDGFLVCYNHPVWSLHNSKDYLGLKGLWGVEVYNTGSARAGYEDTTQPFEDLLRENERIIPVCADDSHVLKSSAYGGWTMIKSSALTYDNIINALEKGDCYSSTGPEIKELYIEDGIVNVTTSNAVFIKLVTGIRFAKSIHATQTEYITQASFDINSFIKEETKKDIPHRNTSWFRLEVKDAKGYRAYTRAYFIDEINLLK